MQAEQMTPLEIFIVIIVAVVALLLLFAGLGLERRASRCSIRVLALLLSCGLGVICSRLPPRVWLVTLGYLCVVGLITGPDIDSGWENPSFSLPFCCLDTQ